MDTGLGSRELPFEAGGAHVAQGGVEPLPVVPRDILAERIGRVAVTLPLCVRYQFRLQGRKETFHRRKQVGGVVLAERRPWRSLPVPGGPRPASGVAPEGGREHFDLAFLVTAVIDNPAAALRALGMGGPPDFPAALAWRAAPILGVSPRVFISDSYRPQLKGVHR